MESHMPASNLPKTNEEIREQYFKEKKVEFERGCADGRPMACFSLGEWHQLVDKNVPKAAPIYEDNCFIRNDSNSCSNLARLYFAKHSDRETIFALSKQSALKNLPSHRDRAQYLFGKSCNVPLPKNGINPVRNFQACTAFATLELFRKDLDKPAYNDAIKVLREACDENETGGCFKLGSTLIRPPKAAQSFGIERDPQQAKKYLEKGCKLGHANCCQVLAVMYKTGDGVAQDISKFEEYKNLTEKLVDQTAQTLGKNSI